MPTANWGMPTPAADYAEQPSPGGLAGFFNQPDIGSEIGERLGLIGEILSRTGSGQGLAGISGQMGQMNERSAARKDRRRKQQLADRMADKIEGSNPELAGMMRANPDFAMELIGKRALAKDQSGYELDKLKEIEKYKAEAAQRALEADPAYQFMQRFLKGGGATPAATAPAVTPPVTDTQAITAAPLPPPGEPPAMGQGNEPAPTVAPQPPVVAQPQPPPIPLKPKVVPPELSPDPQIARMQAELSDAFQVPIYPTDVINLISSVGKGEGVFSSVLAGIQQREDAKQQEIQKANIKSQEPILNELAYRGQVDPVGGHRGPMSQGQVAPYEMPGGVVGPSPENLAILKDKGFSDEAIGQMADLADPSAERIVSAERAGGATPATTVGQIAGELGKTREDIATAAEANLQGKTAQEAATQMLKTIVPDRQGNYSPDQQQTIAELTTVAGMKDVKAASEALNRIRDTNEGIDKNLTDAGFKEREVTLSERKDQREVDKVARELAEAELLQEGEQRATYAQAADAIDNLNRTIPLLNAKSNEIVHGPGGWVMSFYPGSTRNRIERFIGVVDNLTATGALQTMRKYNKNGASLGNVTDTDIQLLKNSVADAKGSLANEEDAEYALKKLYNHFTNILTPDSGKRMSLEKPGFGLEEFDLKRDNYPLWLQQQNRKKKNAIITDEGSITED